MDVHAERARLDALSRERALAADESLTLEWCLWRIEGGRMRWGLNKEVARLGIKRDMARFRKPVEV